MAAKATGFLEGGAESVGNLTSHTDGNGITNISTQYDANNNVIQVTHGTQVSTYAYDKFDRLQQQGDPFGAKANITYDANGNKTAVITQDGKVTKYSYDALNRVTGLVSPSGTISYSYDRSSLNTGIAYSNGVTTSTTHDAAKRVKTVVHARGSNTLSRTEYEYDKNGNRTRETINRTGGAQATNTTYDDADRLTQTEVIDPDKTVTTSYVLDAVAKRTNETVSTTATKNREK